MKILGYFNQDRGGWCKPCDRRYRTGDKATAIRHFEIDHDWECLHVGTESERTDEGLCHYTVYHYGTK
jgi:hypothetical protein